MQLKDTQDSPDAGSRVYLDFYNLREAPFSITPDPEFLFHSKTHDNALQKIRYGIRSKLGFILLAGEVGTGKTTVCRSLLDSLGSQTETVYIINPSLNGTELISCILDDLGIDYPRQASKKVLIDRLNHYLLSADSRRTVVIIIDDAQTMGIEALEDLRLLSNLETDKHKLLQILLIGQPELLKQIARPELRQLKQRIAVTCRLDFLSAREIEGYIHRRLFVAGDKGKIHFNADAVKRIYAFSKGVPRLINQVCDLSLTAAYLADAFAVNHRHVKQAIRELNRFSLPDGSAGRRPGFRRRRVIALLLALAVFAGVYYFWQHRFLWSRGGALPEAAAKKTPAAVYSFAVPTAHGDPSSGDPEPDATQKNASPAASADTPLFPAAPSKKEAGGAGNAPPVSTISDTTPDAADLGSDYYVLQIGSFRNETEARQAVTFYESQGLPAYCKYFDMQSSGEWFAVYIGRFTTLDEALSYAGGNQLERALVRHITPTAAPASEKSDPL